jgi:hypothetical protein
MLLQLEDWELVECDTGLRGVEHARIPEHLLTDGERKQKSQIRGRHENVNGKLKMYGEVSLILCADIELYITGTDRRTVRAPTVLSLTQPFNTGYRVKYPVFARILAQSQDQIITNPNR